MKEKNQSILSLALRVWGRTIAAGVMCAVVYISMTVLATGLLSHTVGYRLYGVDENQETYLIEEYYFQNGETLESLGVTAGENQTLQKISELSGGAERGTDIVTQVMMLLLLGIFPYSMLWELGSRDDNRVRFKHQTFDPKRGLKIGLLAAVPSALLYVLLWGAKLADGPAWMLVAYRFLNIPVLPFINWVIGKEVAVPAAIALWKMLLLVLPLLIVPAVSAVAYLLGYRQFSIHERLTYKNTKSPKTGSGQRSADDGEI